MNLRTIAVTAAFLAVCFATSRGHRHEAVGAETWKELGFKVSCKEAGDELTFAITIPAKHKRTGGALSSVEFSVHKEASDVYTLPIFSSSVVPKVLPDGTSQYFVSVKKAELGKVSLSCHYPGIIVWIYFPDFVPGSPEPSKLPKPKS